MSKKSIKSIDQKKIELNELFQDLNKDKSQPFVSLNNPILVSCRESVMENRRSFYGRFYIGPLEIGQGITLANALRRILLSELTGLAITSVEIEGISHEYSSISGVRESVLDILLNLKQIVLKSKIALKRPQIAYIHCKGPGVLRAADIVLPSFIQCVDPEQYIATLSYNGSLKIKLIIRRGKTYLVQKPLSNNISFLSESNLNKKIIYPSSTVQLDLSKISAKNVKQLIKGKDQNDNKFIKQILPILDNSKFNELELIKFLLKKKKLSRTKFFSNFLPENYKKLESLRSIRQIFERSKSKQWFISLLKKQLISTISSHLVLKSNSNDVSSINVKDYKSESLIFTSITKSLSIDSIFMPVTRVNYILEENSQKLFDEFFHNDFSKSINQSNVELKGSKTKIKPNLNNNTDDSDFSMMPLKTSDIYAKLKQNNFETYWSFFNEEYIQTVTNFTPVLYSTQYFEQFNKSPKEIIILEIWTNGSLLPRSALNEATRKLLCLLLKFQKAKMMKSSFYKTNTNYYKLIQNLYRHYDYSNYNILQQSTPNGF
jgi:DNA-directed RNA polymerase alpha subunit